MLWIEYFARVRTNALNLEMLHDELITQTHVHKQRKRLQRAHTHERTYTRAARVYDAQLTHTHPRTYTRAQRACTMR